MGEIIKRLWARVYNWLWPRPPEIIGADYLADYQGHHKRYQAEILKCIRGMADDVPNDTEKQRKIAWFRARQSAQSLHSMVIVDTAPEGLPEIVDARTMPSRRP